MPPIVDKVKGFLFADAGFAEETKAFIEESTDVVELDEEEYKLQLTVLHERFLQLFEHRVTSFIEREGSTVIQFYEALAKTADDETSDEAAFASSLMAFIDFDSFVVLLRETKRGHSWTISSMFEQ